MGCIRLLLALSVVVWHVHDAPLRMLNASVAVVCFFMISGFYMAMVINEKYAKDDGKSWMLRFYRARLWRLYPAYFAVLVATVALFVISHHPNPFTERLPIPLAEQMSLVFLNVAVIGQDLHQTFVRAIDQNSGPQLVWFLRDWLGGYFFQDSVMMVGQAWSLSSEFLFYLLAPFIVRSPRRTAVALAGALVIRYVLIVACGWRSGIWGYWFFPGAICLFLMGSAAYHIRRVVPLLEWHPAIGWLSLAGLALWFVPQIMRGEIVMASDAQGAIDGVSFWLFYVCFALSVPFIFEATKTARLDRLIGELSYPLYLVHGVVVGIVFHFFNHHQVAMGSMYELVAIMVSLGAAAALYVVVEIPSERYRQRFSRRQAIRVALADHELVTGTGT